MFYTGKGDKGTTGLYGKKGRFLKDGSVLEALGALDECNSYIGLCKVGSMSIEKEEIDLHSILHETQENLFIIQAQIAGAKKNITKSKIKKIEKIIETIENTLPPIKDFTISGSSDMSAKLDIVRTLARKAERRVVAVQSEDGIEIKETTLMYLNRLSSLFYALARYTEHVEGVSRNTPTYM